MFICEGVLRRCAVPPLQRSGPRELRRSGVVGVVVVVVGVVVVVVVVVVLAVVVFVVVVVVSAASCLTLLVQRRCSSKVANLLADCNAP